MVNPLLLPVLIDGARAVLDRLFPDPAERARAEVALRQVEAEGTFAERAAQAQALAQIEVNKAEATTDGYRGGWRPFVGWVCGVALAWQFVARPVAAFAIAAGGHPVPELPSLDGALWELLLGMLGLGALRTFERVKGRA